MATQALLVTPLLLPQRPLLSLASYAAQALLVYDYLPTPTVPESTLLCRTGPPRLQLPPRRLDAARDAARRQAGLPYLQSLKSSVGSVPWVVW